MDALECIFGRRTIRRFRQSPIQRDELLEIVRAGVWACTAGNRQVWEFILVDEAAQVERLHDVVAWLGGEPGEGERPTAYVVALLPSEGRSWAAEADCAAALQNMQLAAWAKGIGGCWIGSVKRDEAARILDLEESGRHLYSILALGYPAEEPVATETSSSELRPSRDAEGRLQVPKKPMEDVLHMQSFGRNRESP